MENLKTIVDEAVAELEGVISAGQKEQIAKVIEAAAIRGHVEGQHHAIDVCKNFSEAEQDLAHQIAAEITRKKDALVANLSSLR